VRYAFSHSTAEQVVAVVNAVTARGVESDVGFVSDFADVSGTQAQAALDLAVDLGLLSTTSSGAYLAASSMCLFFATPEVTQRAAALRVVLESFRPFQVFRERLVATGDTSSAARETKTLLALSAHREDIKETLVSLGTFSQALLVEAGGKYRPHAAGLANDLDVLAQACNDAASAEDRVKQQISDEACALVSNDEVVTPLARGLLHAVSGDGRSAVVYGGNAIESYLVGLALRKSISLVGKNGIISKLQEIKSQTNLPTKLLYIGFYLGHLRNASDHGTDPDIGATWIVRRNTGLEYVYVACSFIAVMTRWEKSMSFEI
jgi:hypothetical protein